MGSHCSPSFFRAYSRKLVINASRPFASIFSMSLRSFLESKSFLSSETTLCEKNRIGSNQPTQIWTFLRLRCFRRKNFEEAPSKSSQIAPGEGKRSGPRNEVGRLLFLDPVFLHQNPAYLVSKFSAKARLFKPAVFLDSSVKLCPRSFFKAGSSLEN